MSIAGALKLLAFDRAAFRRRASGMGARGAVWACEALPCPQPNFYFDKVPGDAPTGELKPMGKLPDLFELLDGYVGQGDKAMQILASERAREGLVEVCRGNAMPGSQKRLF